MAKSQKKPRGIRNNNPGNLEWGQPWQGLVAETDRTDERFCQFRTPVDGIRAIARTLITYQDKRKAPDGSRIDSVREVIGRWAPANENDTESYARSVAQLLGGGIHVSDEVIDVHNYDHLKPLVEGIIRHECGPGPLTTKNTWYANDVIDEGLKRAGVVPTAKQSAVKSNASAVGVGSLGVVQLADFIPSFLAHWQGAQEDVTSGDIMRIVFGVGTIAIAGYLVYSQYRKRAAGIV